MRIRLLRLLDKSLRTVMWLGAPGGLFLSWALELFGVQMSKPVGGFVCFAFGVFVITLCFIGLTTLL